MNENRTSHIISILRIKKVKNIILYGLLIFFTLLQVYPFLWLILFSLKSNTEIFGGNISGFPKEFLWQNYQNAFFGGKVGLYFFNSVLVTGFSIIITLIVSSMAAYAIARMRWKLSKAAMILFLLGMMIPIHAALLPLFIFFKQLRLLNTYWCLILPYVGFGMPIAMYILVGFMQGIPKEMEESAFMDGAGIIKSFFFIILPMVRPALATVSIFSFLSAWNELMFAITFISKEKFRTLTVGLQTMVGQYSTQWGPIGAGLVIATLPTILIYILLSREVQNSLAHTGAVKG